jgi:hypothetical protein
MMARPDVLRGKVRTASPSREIRDTGAELMLARWPGVETLKPTLTERLDLRKVAAFDRRDFQVVAAPRSAQGERLELLAED